MRKLAARSIVVGLLALSIPGCSSGGHKSFSWSSLNPMTYMGKSDSDSPVPKPSDQMAPDVTLGEESDLAGGNSMAPPSPYSAAQAVAGLNAGTQSPSGSVTPQQGRYDVNGYAGTSVPVSSSSTPSYDPYSSSSLPNSGYTPPTDYQMPSGYTPPSGYETNSGAQYALGGNYDIQGQSQGSTSGPAYVNPSSPYAANAGPSGYQLPATPSQASGYDAGLAQGPYGSTTPPLYSGTSTAPPVSNGSYAAPTYGNPAGSGDVNSVASLPSLPPLPSEYGQPYTPGQTGYNPGQTNYNPGQTDYNPPNVPEYTPPLPGGYVQPATATAPSYTPGSVSRYPSSSQTVPATGGVGSYGSTGSTY